MTLHNSTHTLFSHESLDSRSYESLPASEQTAESSELRSHLGN